ncbi:hypothetical protein, partial [Alistipes putredinis]|uniref:hypothetical protein n=1 Tax=Alistipes putredinis TaxID=28117 RepID=UPI001EDA12DC
AGLGFRFSTDGQEAAARDDDCTIHVGKSHFEHYQSFDIGQHRDGITKVVVEWVAESGAISGLTLSDTFAGLSTPQWSYKQYDA